MYPLLLEQVFDEAAHAQSVTGELRPCCVEHGQGCDFKQWVTFKGSLPFGPHPVFPLGHGWMHYGGQGLPVRCSAVSLASAQ